MKFQIVVLVCFIAYALAASPTSPPAPSAAPSAAPEGEDFHAETLRLETENNGVDKYNFAYETSNGISRSEQGELKTTEDGAAIVVQGSTTWTAPDGKKFELTFTADELGYHPSIKLVA